MDWTRNQTQESQEKHRPEQISATTVVIEHDVGEEQEQEQEEGEEQEHDRYRDNPELLGETKSKATRLFSFDWASGFVSPFRPTPQDILSNLLRHVDFSSPGKDSLLDLGCGDGLVLIQALETFPRSQLARAVGVDLDKSLLETARDRILKDHGADVRPRIETSTARTTITSCDNDHDSSNDYAILPRLELYHGDLTTKDDALCSVMNPAAAENTLTKSSSGMQITMRGLLDDCSHLFVYLLPEALSKLAPLLVEAVTEQHKMVLSMRWEIPELRHFLVHGGVEHQFYIYGLQGGDKKSRDNKPLME